MTTITGWLLNIWPLVMLLVIDDIAAAYISAPMWMTQGEWQWALKVSAPAIMYFSLIAFFFILRANSVTLKSSFVVMKVLVAIQIYILIGKWTDFGGLATAYGYGGFKIPYAAVTASVGGGQILITTSFLTLLMIAIEAWDIAGKNNRFVAQWKEAAEQRFWNFVRGRKRFTEANTGTHGTAKLIPSKELLEFMVPEDQVRGLHKSADPDMESEKIWAIPIGLDSCEMSEFDRAKVLWLPLDSHVYVEAGSGGGKGVGIIQPACLHFPGSMVVLDPQDENREMTANYRAKKLGHKIYWIKPTDVPYQRQGKKHHTHGINPLSTLNPDSDAFISEVNALAHIIIKEGTSNPDANSGNAAYFVDSAANLMAAMIASEVAGSYYEGKPAPTLREIYRLLSLPAETIQSLIYHKFADPNLPAGLYGPATDDVVALGAPSYGLAQDTWSGVTSQISARCKWLADGKYARLVSSNTLKPEEIINGNMTVYINLTMEEFKAYPALPKLIINSFIKAQTSNIGHGQKVLYVLDEMVQMGKADFLHIDAVQGNRKDGVLLMGIVQSSKTAKKVLGEEAISAWKASADVRLMSAVGEDDREDVSRLLGKTTAVSFGSRGAGRNNIASGSVSGEADSHSETARDLMTPDEVGTLGYNKWILVIREQRPALIGKLAFYDKKLKSFFKHPFLKGKGDENRRITGNQKPTAMPEESEKKSILKMEPHLYQPMPELDLSRYGLGAVKAAEPQLVR
jgi:type IV secretory pathway TraG/TraD family ATPase VirD4